MQIRSPVVGAMITPTSAPRFETPTRSKSSPSRFDSPLRGSPGEARFAPQPFRYNGRVAISLIPAVLVLLGAGGTPVVGTLVVGLMISYILDALQFKKGAFIGLWGSLFATSGALTLAGSSVRAHYSPFLSILVILASCHLIFFCGVWGSLQFRWLQIEYPTIVLALERLLFSCCPIIGTVVQTWGIISSVGIEHGGFYLMAIYFVMFWLFVLPRTTSFQSKSRLSAGVNSTKDSLILGPLETSLHCLVLIFWPLAFHVSIHYVNALTTWFDLYDEVLLFFIPLLFLLFASTRGALDWLSRDRRQLHIIRLVNGTFAVVVILACIELRVIFRSFGHYIQLPFPFNYILVTIAVYGISLGLFAHFFGLIKGKSAHSIATVILTIAALAGAIAIGMPWKMWFAPAIAAICFAQFYSQGQAQFYFLFMLSSTLSFSWFIIDHFLFLDARLAGLTLHSICYQFIACILLSFVVPFTVMFLKANWLTGLVLVAQAILLSNLENHFYNLSHDEENVYPTYLVIVTSAAGYFCALKLQNEKKINAFFSYIVKCLYLSKLSILFLSSPDAIFSSSILLLAIMPPIFLYQDKSKGHRMKEWQALIHCALISLSLWICRYTIFDILYLVLGHRPSQSLVLSSLFLLSTLFSSPIVFLHFSHSQPAKQTLILSLSFSLLFLYLQPPFPSFLSFFWNESHMPEEEKDDISIYGLSTSTSWASWLLLFCIIGGLASAMSALPIFKYSIARLAYASCLGVASGIYFCLKYFKDAHVLYPLLLIACVCICITLVFTHSPPSSGPRFQPWTFTLFILLLPVMYTISRSDDVFTPEKDFLEDEEEEYFSTLITHETMRSSLLGLYCASLLLTALVVKLKLSSTSFSERESKSDNELPRGSPFIANHRSIKKTKSSSVIRSLTLKKLLGEHTWMPSIGNISSLLAFSLAILLNTYIKGTEKSIFFIAPILLLLNEDSSVSSSFTDRQRYFPVTVSISVYLFFVSIHYLWNEVKAMWFGLEELKFDLESSSAMFLLKNGLFLILTLPNHVLFNAFMWDYSKIAVGVLLFVTPFNLVPAILSEVNPIKLMAMLSIAFSAAQYLISRNLKIAGLKYI